MSLELIRAVDNHRRRLDRLEASDRGVPGGTAFPTGIAAGFVFFRSDLGFLCYYDGTRWLTENELQLPLEDWASFGTSSPQASNLMMPRGQYSPYITRVLVHTRVAATNDGSNYWTIDLQGLNTSAGASTTVYSFTTAGDTAATITRRDSAPTTADPANSDWFRVAFSKTGNPGAIEYALTMTYKLIVT